MQTKQYVYTLHITHIVKSERYKCMSFIFGGMTNTAVNKMLTFPAFLHVPHIYTECIVVFVLGKVIQFCQAVECWMAVTYHHYDFAILLLPTQHTSRLKCKTCVFYFIMSLYKCERTTLHGMHECVYLKYSFFYCSFIFIVPIHMRMHGI